MTWRVRIGWIAWRTLGTLGLAGVLTAFVQAARHDSLGYDLTRIALRGSDAIVHGQPLYLTDGQWRHLSDQAFAYVYPPFYAEVISPLLLIPDRALGVIAAVACLACADWALWILGVRDPRVYVVTVCSYPVLAGAQVANASMLLMPLLALAWKHRGPVPVAVALAVKPVMWLTLMWLWLSRGKRAAARALLLALVLILGSWAIIGFEGLGSYRSTLDWNDRTNSPYTYGLPGWLGFLTAAGALGLAWRRHRAGDEGGVFTYTILASLHASPIVWMHTFTALLIPLAIRRPTYTPLWLVPVAAWLAAHSNTTVLPEAMKVVVWIAVVALVVRLGERPLHRAVETAGEARPHQPLKGAFS